MKKLVTLLSLILITTLGFGQQVNAPDPKEFTVNTSGQDASGFTLSGFNSTDVLLCAVGLPVAPTGTTFYFSTTTGVTASTGYSMSGNKTRISFTGTQANINNVLASLKINTTGTSGDISISVSATVNPTGYYYLPTNGHFYKPMSGFSGIGFTGNTVAGYNNLKTYCSNQSFKGQTGYLMTITSADEDNFVYNNVPGSNIIFALTDNAKEGTFVIDAGPENGTVIKTQNGTGGNVAGKYNNWASGEPNNWGSGENYVVTKWNGGTQWNDYGPAATSFPGGISGYVIEFGTWTNPDDQTFTSFYNNSVTHTNGPNLNLKALFNFNFGGNVDETKFSTSVFKRNDATSNWTANTYKSLNGLGRVTMSDQLDTAKVYSSAIQLTTGTTDMTAFSTSDIGKIYKLTITGTANGDIWGTNIYTNDSYIPRAAVHAGVITVGQTKEVYIKVVEGQNDYPSSTQNGVTSSSWGGWGLSYQFVSQPSSYKATISAGQAEYSYVNPNASWLGTGMSRLLIDMRTFGSVLPNTIQKVKILDCYDGPVTFLNQDASWAQYTVPSPLTKVTDGTSAYNSNIRNVNNWNTDYAFTSTLSFSQIGAYKQHKLVFNDYDSNQLKTLYNSIVTVSDVWLAFKEVANVGIFGNQSGNEFTYGIQYSNADVNGDNVFDEKDAFLLLQHLTGARDLISSYTLDNTMKIILDSTYASIGKSTWQSFPNLLGKEYGFSLLDNKINYNYNLAVTWKGDVNLSHSATPPSNGITTMAVRTMAVSTDVQSSILTELSNGKVYAYITFDPLQQNVVGTQYQLNYDNSVLKFEGVEFKTKGSPMNFGTNKGTFVSLGSLVTDGSTSLDNTTEYKIIFTPIKPIINTLGLMGIGSTDAVNKDGKQLKVKIN